MSKNKKAKKRGKSKKSLTKNNLKMKLYTSPRSNTAKRITTGFWKDGALVAFSINYVNPSA